MRKKEIEVYEFDFHIYPAKLLIVIGNNWDKTKELFADDSEFENKESPLDHANAFVMTGFLKDKKNTGVCMCFPNRKQMTVSNIAHESVHVASDIFEMCIMTIGFEQGADETFAYLVGYAAECCEKAKKKRVPDKSNTLQN